MPNTKPVYRLAVLAVAVAAIGATVYTMRFAYAREAAPAASSSSSRKATPPPLPESEIRARMAALLAEMGNLSGYIARVDADGTVYLMNVKDTTPPTPASATVAASAADPDIKIHPRACGGIEINPSAPNLGVSAEALSLSSRALEALNGDIARRQPLVTSLHPVPYACSR